MVRKKIAVLLLMSLFILAQASFAEVVESTESEEAIPVNPKPGLLKSFNNFTKELSNRLNGKKSEKETAADEKVISKKIPVKKESDIKQNGKLEVKSESVVEPKEKLVKEEKIVTETSPIEDTSSEVKTVVRTRTNRELRAARSLSAGINWGLINMWIPNKLGGNLQYNYSETTTIALDYQSAGYKAAVFDFKFGEIKESKYGVQIKSFGSSNTFFLSYSLMRYQFKAELGTDLFGPMSLPFAPLFDIGSLGLQFGLGNQWNWDNGFTFAVEWFSVYYHAFAKTKNTEIFNYLNANDRDKANKVVDLIYNLPIIELLKIQLNYSF